MTYPRSHKEPGPKVYVLRGGNAEDTWICGVYDEATRAELERARWQGASDGRGTKGTWKHEMFSVEEWEVQS